MDGNKQYGDDTMQTIDISDLMERTKRLLISYKENTDYLLRRNNQLRRKVAEQIKYIKYASQIVRANANMCDEINLIINEPKTTPAIISERLKEVINKCSLSILTAEEEIQL